MSDNNQLPPWFISDECLSLTIPNDEPSISITSEIKWFQFMQPKDVGQETEIEKREKQEAIQEQIRRGILKVSGNNIEINKTKQPVIKTNNIVNNMLKSTKPLTNIPNFNTLNSPCPCGSGQLFKDCHGKQVNIR